MNIKQINEEIENCTAKKLSVLICPLNGKAPYVSYQPRIVMRSASTIKTAIMCRALFMCEAGELNLKKRYTVNNILPDSEIFEDGAEEKTLYQLLYHMITVSDNTSTNALIDLLGFEGINSYIKTIPGVTNTVLRRKMLDWDAVEKGLENTTSANDMFCIFSELYNGQLLDIGLTAVAFEILYAQRCRDSLLRYVTENIQAAHKTGGLDFLNHDCGIFRVGNEDVYAGVFVDGTEKNDLYAKKFMGRIGKYLYDEY